MTHRKTGFRVFIEIVDQLSLGFWLKAPKWLCYSPIGWLLQPGARRGYQALLREFRSQNWRDGQ